MQQIQREVERQKGGQSGWKKVDVMICALLTNTRFKKRAIRVDAREFSISISLLVFYVLIQAQDCNLKEIMKATESLSGIYTELTIAILNLLISQIFLPHLMVQESTQLGLKTLQML